MCAWVRRGGVRQGRGGSAGPPLRPPPASSPYPAAARHAGRAVPTRRCLQACRRGPGGPEPDSEPGPGRTSSAVTWRAAPPPGWAPDACAYKHQTGFASAASRGEAPPAKPGTGARRARPRPADVPSRWRRTITIWIRTMTAWSDQLPGTAWPSTHDLYGQCAPAFCFTRP